jgi:hypothetical protein
VNQDTPTIEASTDQIMDDLLFSLMMLIIEGRLPDSNSIKGYKEGMHVNIKKSNHQCLTQLNDVSFK